MLFRQRYHRGKYWHCVYMISDIIYSWSLLQILQPLRLISRMHWLCFPTCLPQIKWPLLPWPHHLFHQEVQVVWDLQLRIHSVQFNLLLSQILNISKKINSNLDSFSLKILGEVKPLILWEQATRLLILEQIVINIRSCIAKSIIYRVQNTSVSFPQPSKGFIYLQWRYPKKNNKLVWSNSFLNNKQM